MRIRLFVPVAIAAGLAAGCSLIGLGIGTVIDGDKKATTVPGWMIESVRPGRKVTLALRDGRIVKGTYRGLDGVTAGETPLRSAVAIISGSQAARVLVADVIQVQVHGGKARLIGCRITLSPLRKGCPLQNSEIGG